MACGQESLVLVFIVDFLREGGGSKRTVLACRGSQIVRLMLLKSRVGTSRPPNVNPLLRDAPKLPAGIEGYFQDCNGTGYKTYILKWWCNWSYIFLQNEGHMYIKLEIGMQYTWERGFNFILYNNEV